jgi:hypothetical protein
MAMAFELPAPTPDYYLVETQQGVDVLADAHNGAIVERRITQGRDRVAVYNTDVDGSLTTISPFENYTPPFVKTFDALAGPLLHSRRYRALTDFTLRGITLTGDADNVGRQAMLVINEVEVLESPIVLQNGVAVAGVLKATTITVLANSKIEFTVDDDAVQGGTLFGVVVLHLT